MGLYPITCGCGKTFLWFSGNLDSRCPDCIKIAEQQQDEFLDQMDRQINKTKMVCGHKPCSLGHCKGCEEHCGKGNEYEIITKTDC